MRLNGKTALITGGDQGIGRGVALRFAHEGANVAIVYRKHADNAQEVVKEIRGMSRNAVAVQGDVSSVQDVQNFCREAARQIGPLDILVNNAGVEKKAAFLETSEEDWDMIVDVNLKGAFFAAQAFAKALVDEKRKGSIINMSSVHEELPFPNFAPYCASKGGMKMLTRDLAVELAPYGIRVNGIAPGAIKTPINESLMQDKSKLDPLLANIPLGRLGTPEDVAGAAVFLASDDASYVTATTLFVDGGLLWNYHEQ